MADIKGQFDITGQIIAVTGGAGVLCSAMAKMLAAHGAKVAVLDLFEDKAQEVAGAIKADGGEAIAVKCNVLDKGSVEEACRAVIDAYGTVDTLINGAGGNKKEATTSPDLSFFDLPADAVQWVFNLNIIGTILPSQVFGKVMAEKKKGNILNMSSMSAFKPLTKVLAYSAAKAGVSSFTMWLAVHISQNYSKEIRVNALAPGFFLTEQNRFLLTDEKTGKPTQRGQQIIDHTPMGKYGQPEDLLGTTLWLLSPASSFVHGAVIPIDGGFSAYSGV
ncbi:MAG: SDR family oxidoreductase [Phycisphaerae bacterium]|nr:SDR family oxidoreductase [Phycisphaerae bacterium]